MRLIVFFILTSFFATSFANNDDSAFNLEKSKQRCAQTNSEDLPLYSSEFQWWYSRKEMAKKFDEVYQSGKRLPKRAFYNHKDEEFYVPRKSISGNTELVRLSAGFIQAVTRHIETALDKGYAEFIFFPDMGHSHLYIPQTVWDEQFSPTPPVAEFHKLYEQMLNEPTMLALYHTAEQLSMYDEDGVLYDDEYLKHRYYNRNPVGDNLGHGIVKMPTALDKTGNAVSNLPGFKSWSAGYSISASKNGCFSYENKGKVYYFDISLKDLELPPGSSGYD